MRTRPVRSEFGTPLVGVLPACDPVVVPSASALVRWPARGYENTRGPTGLKESIRPRVSRETVTGRECCPQVHSPPAERAALSLTSPLFFRLLGAEPIRVGAWGALVFPPRENRETGAPRVASPVGPLPSSRGLPLRVGPPPGWSVHCEKNDGLQGF